MSTILLLFLLAGLLTCIAAFVIGQKFPSFDKKLAEIVEGAIVILFGGSIMLMFWLSTVIMQYLLFLPLVGIPKFFYVWGRNGIRKAGEYMKEFLTLQEGPAKWPWDIQ